MATVHTDEPNSREAPGSRHRYSEAAKKASALLDKLGRTEDEVVAEIDANILIRAVLGTRVRELIEEYGADTSCFAPDFASTGAARLSRVSARRYLEYLASASGATRDLDDATLGQPTTRCSLDRSVSTCAAGAPSPAFGRDRDAFLGDDAAAPVARGTFGTLGRGCLSVRDQASRRCLQ